MAWTLKFSDTFTDVDYTALEDHTPDVGTGWTRIAGGIGHGSFRIATGGVSLGVVGSGMYTPADSIADDQAVEFTVASGAVDDYLALLRHDGNASATTYRFQISGGVVVLRIINAGAPGSTLASGGSVVAGDVVRYEAIGATTLNAYVNGSLAFTYDASGDSPLLTSGAVSVQFDRTIDGAGDSFKVYEDAGGGGSILPLVAVDMRNMADMGGMRG